MQYYEDLDNSDTVAIIFEGEEVFMGLRLMEDMVGVIKKNGGKASPDMRQWLSRTKAKFIPPHRTIN